MNDKLRAVLAILRLSLRQRAANWLEAKAERLATKMRASADALRNGGVGPRK